MNHAHTLAGVVTPEAAAELADAMAFLTHLSTLANRCLLTGEGGAMSGYNAGRVAASMTAASEAVASALIDASVFGRCPFDGCKVMKDARDRLQARLNAETIEGDTTATASNPDDATDA